jgi:pantetheine-phosphate adenylyltransferase
MKKVIFPGTFDPPTFGHLNVAKRASQLFDYVYIAIGANSLKDSPFFTIEERVQLLKAITHEIPNIEIITFSGLLVDFAQQLGVNAILKAVRSASDFDYENIQAQMNQKLADIETMFLVADERYRYISSSLIREIASYGKRLHAFIPPGIEQMVFDRLSKKENDKRPVG